MRSSPKPNVKLLQERTTSSKKRLQPDAGGLSAVTAHADEYAW